MDLSRKVDAFNTIATALVIQKQIVVSYTQKHRTVNPYKLINTNGIWYLVGVEDGVLKNFSFSKITELESLEDTFKIDKNVIETLKDHNGVWFTQNHIEVVLEIDTSVAEYFLRRELLPSQKTIESTEEMLVLSTQVAYEEEILKVVRYWIPHITIRSPHHLQEKLEESLQNYLNKSSAS